MIRAILYTNGRYDDILKNRFLSLFFILQKGFLLDTSEFTLEL